MSSGVKGVSRVSIPGNVKKMIDNIKEITGQNHSEDEIYAMLKECSMDPNETTQKLLLLDTFHEVKRKRDRKKEIQNISKEPAESRLRPCKQTWASRGGRGSYSSRYISHDVGGGRNLAAIKETNTSHLSDKGIHRAPLATAQETIKNEPTSVASPITAMSNFVPSGITSQSTNAVYDNHASASRDFSQSNSTGNVSMSKLEGMPSLSSSADSIKNHNILGTRDKHQHLMLDVSIGATSMPSAPASGSYFSFSGPVQLPSQDVSLPSPAGTIRSEVGIVRTPGEMIADNPTESKTAFACRISASEDGNSNLQQNMPIDFQELGKAPYVVSLQMASSTIGVFTVSRPSSNYNNRSQVVGPQKVGAGKEWKPKSTNPIIAQGVATVVSSEVPTATVESNLKLQPTPVVLACEEATLELQRKLEDSHISDGHHVIMPNHLHVPEAGKLGFCFGSFDSSFGLDNSNNGFPESDKSPPVSESSVAIDEPPTEQPSSNQNVLVAVEEAEIKYPDHSQSPSQGPNNFSFSEGEVSSSIIPDHSNSKQEIASGSPLHHVVHTSSNYNFGFMPPILSGQLAPLEGLESQARDASRLPGFIMQQPFDPTNYYTQFYHSGVDSDGQISPFYSAGAANKFNANAALVSAQASHSPQEGGVPLVLSTASPTPLLTQAAGVMQNSVTAAQQPLPVFRQPTAVHVPHYPPNFIPYGSYFSPFYVTPPAMHQFFSNDAFPQQPQAGSMYPTPPGTAAKFSVSQYKQGSNMGSSTHTGVPDSYGPHGLSVANYIPNSATAAITSVSNEDLAAPQVKENDTYVGGHQNEGLGVWFTGLSRDMSTLQASSFYNLPQGQLAFTPTQPGHGAFTGIFHPAQAVAAAPVHPLLQQSQAITSPIDIGGPTASVYQQQQHAQLNWPSNY